MNSCFQDIDPAVVVLFSALYANYLAVNLPFNVQNLLGNVFQLIGQALLAYNAQQQYFQGGPGRYFDWADRDINNPFCTGRQEQADDDFFGQGGEALLELLSHIGSDARTLFELRRE